MGTEEDHHSFALVVLDSDPTRLHLVDADPGEVGDAIPLSNEVAQFIARKLSDHSQDQSGMPLPPKAAGASPFLVQSRDN